ncbi:MAG: AraC family transcriptional regulator, partial [Perlucidibaca sp.]
MSRPQNTLSMTYVTRLLAGAPRQGVSLASLFTAVGLDPARLDDPEGRVSGSEVILLVQEVMRQTHDEFIGLAEGARSKPGTFSMMAHAVINCPTLGKAIQRSIHFYGLFQAPVRSRFEVVDNEGRLIFELQENSSYAETIHEAMIFISVRFWSWLVGRRLDPLVIEFAHEAPPKAAEFQALFRCPVSYGME